MYETIDTGIYYWTDFITSTESIQPNSGLTFFPNPASDFLQFELPNIAKPATVRLYNASGQQIINQQLTDGKLQLPDLPTGFYCYLIQQDGKSYSGKVIVE